MDLENKTVLITGATGLVGSNLVHKFVRMGNVNVIVLARNLEKIKRCFGEYISDRKIKYVVQDVITKIQCEEPVDYIFHAAGAMAGDVINNYPMDVINANLYGLKNCLDFMYEQKNNTGKQCRLVVFSSVTVYGAREENEVFVSEGDTNTADSLDVPYAAYSESKRMSEVFARAYAKQYDVDVVIGRLSSVYGYTDVIPNTAFYEFIKKALSSRVIELKNPNIKLRDNIYVDDAINGLIYIAIKGQRCEAYNISSNNEKNNYAGVDQMATLMVELVKEKYDLNSKLIMPNTINHYRGVVMDNTKLKQLGWKLNTDLADGIATTLDIMHRKA